MRPRSLSAALLAACPCLVAGQALAFYSEIPAGRFDALAIPDPIAGAGIVAEVPEAIPGLESESSAWAAFVDDHGGHWKVHLDRRSGAPLLVSGGGIGWFDPDGPAPTLPDLEGRARRFVAAHTALLRIRDSQLVLDTVASGPVDADHWILVFNRAVGGVPVEGQRFLLFVTRGKLVSFGADRWGSIEQAPSPELDVWAARQLLDEYMGILPSDQVTEREAGRLVLVPAPAEAAGGGPYAGPAGQGVRYHLAWRFAREVAGERGIWVGKVDAQTGRIIALFDDARYAQVKGGGYPVSNDGLCWDGCEQADYPMPYANVTVGGTQTANDVGWFTCAPGGAAASTALAGPYVRINDTCGAVGESVLCDADLDLRSGAGTDCAVPSGGSAGNTHAARTAFYQINRMAEKGRTWLPSNAWLQQQLEVRVNINATCNATWGGTLNMYKSGGGCRNTGEIAAVLDHEWGHGMDQNDGGGYDNPSEAYADATGMLQTRASCIGRGFFESGNCGGYGDACLDCTGVREQDWDKHASHTPATPQGFAANNCGSGGGPCGKEEHCEAHVAGQAIWDLAVRDLPASGIDAATSWQITEKLFYKSRQGSGGNAYNCALPSSDGCNAGSWFQTMRAIDDEDGNLANGTPHAAALYAAFARHNIACGAPADASNQSSSTCPVLPAPVLTTAQASHAAQLSWTPVADASNYLILRNEMGCDRAHTVIATVAAPATSWTDTDLPNGFTFYYAVQAQGANTACESALSACRSATALPRKGEFVLGEGSTACSETLGVRLRDLDLDTNSSVIETVTVTASSTTQPDTETLVLTETGPATAQFTGSLVTSPGPPVVGDGILQVSDADYVSLTYHDADDGTGMPATTVKTILADCAGPVTTAVRVTDITDEGGTIRWTTSEPSTSRVDWGTTPSLGSVATDGALVTSHAVTLRSIAECARIYFRVQSTDVQGNSTILDAGGIPFAFHAQRIPGLFRDTFEASSGWTLEGEWQIGAPQGKGNQDPSTAFEGTKVLGHDLTGLGGHPGDYEPGPPQRAISPVINASSLTQGRLLFRRWLDVVGTAVSSIEVKRGSTWYTVWSTTGGVNDNAWSLQSIDISQHADANANLQIAFKQTGGTITFFTAGGWNVDRFVVKSAIQPNFESCGGCTGAPSFAGAGSAADVAACADSGITVSWQEAAAWGTGSTGTYSVYRDTSPTFIPSAGNRIATGVSGTSYTDASAPNGIVLYYLVRAENNETCSTGPMNGGVTDANLVRVSASDDLSQPPAGTPGSSLRARNVNDAHVRLSWSPASGAVGYRVTRSDLPSAGFGLLATVTPALFEDRDEITVPASRFYLTSAVNACGSETP